MKLGDLEFNVGDFVLIPTSGGGIDLQHIAEDIRNRANRLLAERLEKALILRELHSPMGTWVNGEPENARATARLVCIEELGK